MSAVTVDTSRTGVRFRVRLQPRASVDEVAGVADGVVRIRLRAPPVDGAANEALVRFLADRLGVRRAAVRIVAGATSRMKTIEIDGLTSPDVARLAEND